ncbi:hypothetical protein [Legionella longbeachae]|uniref:hypothetical protein n=1 Tax=Legionella longbeachae TaxID=450 RepID=UPI00209C196E|nr:hypothetical protein [Legionella longbeachae]
MKFGFNDLTNAIKYCNSVTDTIPVTYTNIPMYQAAIQAATHVLNNLKTDINEEQISELKDAIRQLKSDLYLYYRTELKNAPTLVKSNLDQFFKNEFLQEYLMDHAEEIIKNDQEIQQKFILRNLGIFTKFDKNDITPEFHDIKAKFN